MERLLIGTDAAMLEHRTPAGHPERPERLARVIEALRARALLQPANLLPLREATDDELLRVHSREHLAMIARAEAAGGARVEADTWTAPGSERAARLAAGLALEAVDAVIEGRAPCAFCAVRPPGHHARPMMPMGFCLFSNAAVAAAHAIEKLSISRVLVVDFDVHHGNGTQEIFYADGRVGFFSMHRYPFYPGTGAGNETGAGAGLGFTRNLPITYGTPRHELLNAFASDLQAFADYVRPELVIVSAGFDAHRRDPIGDLGLESEDYETLTRTITDIANSHCGGRVVSLLEGGYNLDMVAECVGVHVETLGGTA